MTVGKRLFYAATGIVVLVLIIMVIGYALPQDHVASVQGIVSRPPAEVFEKLIDVQRYPEWRTGRAAGRGGVAQPPEVAGRHRR